MLDLATDTTLIVLDGRNKRVSVGGCAQGLRLFEGPFKKDLAISHLLKPVLSTDRGKGYELLF